MTLKLCEKTKRSKKKETGEQKRGILKVIRTPIFGQAQCSRNHGVQRQQ